LRFHRTVVNGRTDARDDSADNFSSTSKVQIDFFAGQFFQIRLQSRFFRFAESGRADVTSRGDETASFFQNRSETLVDFAEFGQTAVLQQERAENWRSFLSALFFRLNFRELFLCSHAELPDCEKRSANRRWSYQFRPRFQFALNEFRFRRFQNDIGKRGGVTAGDGFNAHFSLNLR
jgi:hypothetical protein